MLQKAVEVDPKDLSTREELGYTLNKLERYNEALTQLNKGLLISPKATVAQYYKGLSYIGLKNKTEAMKCYTILKSSDKDKADKLLEKINKL
jgi:tetratricopeptide (TPR) repeat protein